MKEIVDLLRGQVPIGEMVGGEPRGGWLDIKAVPITRSVALHAAWVIETQAAQIRHLEEDRRKWNRPQADPIKMILDAFEVLDAAGYKTKGDLCDTPAEGIRWLTAQLKVAKSALENRG